MSNNINSKKEQDKLLERINELSESIDRDRQSENMKKLNEEIEKLEKLEDDESDYEEFLKRFNQKNGTSLRNVNAGKVKRKRSKPVPVILFKRYKAAAIFLAVVIGMATGSLGVKIMADNRDTLSWIKDDQSGVRIVIQNNNGVELKDSSYYDEYFFDREKEKVKIIDLSRFGYKDTVLIHGEIVTEDNFDGMAKYGIEYPSYIPDGVELKDVTYVFGDSRLFLVEVAFRCENRNESIYYSVQLDGDGEILYEITSNNNAKYSKTLNTDVNTAYVFKGDSICEAYMYSQLKLYKISSSLDEDEFCKFVESFDYYN